MGGDAMRQSSFFFLAVGFGNRDAVIVVLLSSVPLLRGRLSPPPPTRSLSLVF